ncbi:DUF1254 domain-containing protein [Thermodesulfobacteriota bacterium]
MQTTLIAAALLILALIVPATDAGAQNKLTPAEAKAIAKEGYLFGLPLVYIATQMDVQTNVAKPEPGRAPVNQFSHLREFPDAANNKIVGMNVDTLYSLAFLDLSAEPIVLSVPPTGDRWWIMQIIDSWNDVPAAPGSRTHGGKGGTFALVGPDWKGELPTGLEEILVDSNLVFLAGRTYTGGKDDYATVRKIQDQYKLIPLSQWKNAGTKYTPPVGVPVKPNVDTKTPIPTQVFKLSAGQFFGRLCELLVGNPARKADAPVMGNLAKLGIKPGAKFKIDAFDAGTRKAIDEGVAAAQQAIREEQPKLGETVNGWQISRDLGRYGTKYLYRATWTFFGVGGNLVEDALYPFSVVDSDGKKLDGMNQYVLRFAKDQVPPVDAFWSLTLYDKDTYLVDNPLNRYALGDRSNMKPNPDGSLTIYIQSESPGADKEANWLPAPKSGPFQLALRMYVPKKQVIDGTWKPPAVEKRK